MVVRGWWYGVRGGYGPQKIKSTADLKQKVRDVGIPPERATAHEGCRDHVFRVRLEVCFFQILLLAAVKMGQEVAPHARRMLTRRVRAVHPQPGAKAGLGHVTCDSPFRVESLRVDHRTS